MVMEKDELMNLPSVMRSLEKNLRYGGADLSQIGLETKQDFLNMVNGEIRVYNNGTIETLRKEKDPSKTIYSDENAKVYVLNVTDRLEVIRNHACKLKDFSYDDMMDIYHASKVLATKKMKDLYAKSRKETTSQRYDNEKNQKLFGSHLELNLKMMEIEGYMKLYLLQNNEYDRYFESMKKTIENNSSSVMDNRLRTDTVALRPYISGQLTELGEELYPGYTMTPIGKRIETVNEKVKSLEPHNLSLLEEKYLSQMKNEMNWIKRTRKSVSRNAVDNAVVGIASYLANPLEKRAVKIAGERPENKNRGTKNNLKDNISNTVSNMAVLVKRYAAYPVAVLHRSKGGRNYLKNEKIYTFTQKLREARESDDPDEERAVLNKIVCDKTMRPRQRFSDRIGGLLRYRRQRNQLVA